MRLLVVCRRLSLLGSTLLMVVALITFACQGTGHAITSTVKKVSASRTQFRLQGRNKGTACRMTSREIPKILKSAGQSAQLLALSVDPLVLEGQEASIMNITLVKMSLRSHS